MPSYGQQVTNDSFGKWTTKVEKTFEKHNKQNEEHKFEEFRLFHDGKTRFLTEQSQVLGA